MASASFRRSLHRKLGLRGPSLLYASWVAAEFVAAMATRFATGPLARAELLGGFVLTAQDDRPIAVIGRRARALLAVLCLEGGSGVPRERICGLLWSDRAEDQARASLRQCLFELKGHLGELGDDLLEIGRERIALKMGMLDSDVEQIRRALGGDDADALAAVAPRLGRGELLEGLEIAGLFQDWLEQARSAFEAALARDVMGCLTRLQAQARWEEVIALADGYLRRDPLQEGLVAAAIRAERAIGRNAAAQKRFEAISQRLTKELGVSVSSELLEAARGEHPAPANLDAQAPASATPRRQSADEPPLGLAPLRPRIGVLPFVHPDGDPEQADFAEALVEDLIGGLSRSPLLAVMPRQSSFAYEPRGQSAGRVCRELGLHYLVRGTVRRLGRNLRVSAELVKGADDQIVWSARYDRPIEDLFSMLDGITMAIVGTVEPALLDQEALRARERADMSLEFWELFVSGRRHFWRSTADDVRQAEAFLTRALQIQPDDAPSLAILAHCKLYDVWVGGSTDPSAAVAEAYRLALKAISVSGSDAFAHYTLGVVLSVMDQWPEAEAQQRRALELNPFLAAALGELGRLLAFEGRVEAAVSYSDRAISASPNDPHAWLWFRSKAIARLLARDLDGAVQDALDACARGAHRFYLHILLAACYAAAGRRDEAARAYRHAESLAKTRNAIDPSPAPAARTDSGLKALLAGHPFQQPHDRERFLAALRDARSAALELHAAD